MDILPLFCDIDDFCLLFEPLWERKLLATRQRRRASTLRLSEVMTIVVLFHASSYRNFKAYYTEQVLKHYAWAFPRLVSYGRFVELMQGALVPLCGYLQSRKGRCSGISFVDSTSLAVCHNRRIHSHKVFEGRARRGKTSVDWFYGFKLHLVVNDPSVRELAVGRAIGYLEAIREDDPENLECLTILRALYGTQAKLLKDRNRPDAAREAFRKSESLVVPIALSRLRDRKQAEPRGVKELSGESLSFPNDYDRQRLRALLSIMERLEGASTIKDAVDYVDTAAEYISLLDTSAREGRGEARRVLRISLNRFHQAQTFGALTPEQEELVEAINKTLKKLPPDD